MAPISSPPPAVLSANSIPFSFFASLVEQIAAVSAKKKGDTRGRGPASSEKKLLTAWVERVKEEHGKDLPAGTMVLFFRLFFPDEGVRRRYGLQEKTLADLLETLFKVSRRGRFSQWNLPSYGAKGVASGCLGEEVRQWMEKHSKGKGKAGGLTLGRADQLLDELASSSCYSADDVRQLRLEPSFRSRSTSAILRDLLVYLSPFETALMIQILLRDISPLLYPPPSVSGDVALARYTSTAYDQVTVHDAMRAWHPGMNRLFLAVADLDWVAWHAEEATRCDGRLPAPVPQVGLPIKIPKTEKPGSCSRATKHLSGPVAIETKYDGERLQIHVDLSLPLHDQIRIFSKSGRNSTQTRRLLLPIIRAALDLPFDPLDTTSHPLLHQRLLSSASAHTPSFPSSATRYILEGEMVPYDESRGCIDEFWELDCAKVGAQDPPAAPVFGTGLSGWGCAKKRRDEESHETGGTGKTPSPRYSSGLSPGGGGAKGTSLHLKIVWFDLLVVGEETLLNEPYELRRARLESLIRPIKGFSMLADSVVINFDHPSSALENLRLRFAHIIAKRCEGLMLKPLSSRYNDMSRGQRWVKLKKDFIPGAGDTLDFHILGASWQKQRGRELLVPPSVWTTFYVGLAAEELGPWQSRENKAHYHVLFSVSYGLSREQLAQVCHEVREGKPERFDLDFLGETVFREVERRRRRGSMPVYESACTSFTFSLAPHLRSASTRPTVMFRKARVMELNGAGFQRASASPYYELRFPRITKFSRSDGSGDPLSLSALQDTATRAMCAAPTDAKSVVEQMWRQAFEGNGPSGETEEEKYKREVVEASGRSVYVDIAPDLRSEPLVLFPPSSCDAASTSATHQVDPSTFALASTSTCSDHAYHFTSHPLSADPPLRRLAFHPFRRPFADLPDLSHPFPSSGFSIRKRRRISSSSRRSSCASLSAALSTLLPQSLSASSLPPSSPSSDSPSPFSACTWSIYPPPSPSADLPHPRHHALDASNFLTSALSVLWAAGFAPPSYAAAPCRGAKRQGYIFVGAGEQEACLKWLLEEVERERRKRDEAALVWVLRKEALETSGDFRIGDDVIMVLS
ncbi:hypothetical protein JCM8097_002484 [Rhodosporidiobolus ruineniae]